MDFLDLNNFHFSKLNILGKGSFGEVFKVVEKKTGNTFAAKISLNQITEDQKKLLTSLRREINTMSQINHPSILKFIGYSPINFFNEPYPVIITEYSSVGTLCDLIELERRSMSNPKWDDTKKLINIYGIAAAMKYLHANGIIHRDLKPANILEDDNLFPKIADFGLAKTLHSNIDSMTLQSTSGFKGTPAYAPPEGWESNEFTKAGDVYAFSIIVYEIMTLQVPFKGCNIAMVCNKVVYKEERPKFDYPIASCYHDLISRCWSQKPIDRPTFDQIVKELQNNEDFIIDTVDKDQYYEYIDHIESLGSSFDKTRRFSKLLPNFIFSLKSGLKMVKIAVKIGEKVQDVKKELSLKLELGKYDFDIFSGKGEDEQLLKDDSCFDIYHQKKEPQFIIIPKNPFYMFRILANGKLSNAKRFQLNPRSTIREIKALTMPSTRAKRLEIYGPLSIDDNELPADLKPFDDFDVLPTTSLEDPKCVYIIKINKIMTKINVKLPSFDKDGHIELSVDSFENVEDIVKDLQRKRKGKAIDLFMDNKKLDNNERFNDLIITKFSQFECKYKYKIISDKFEICQYIDGNLTVFDCRKKCLEMANKYNDHKIRDLKRIELRINDKVIDKNDNDKTIWSQMIKYDNFTEIKVCIKEDAMFTKIKQNDKRAKYIKNNFYCESTVADIREKCGYDFIIKSVKDNSIIYDDQFLFEIEDEIYTEDIQSKTKEIEIKISKSIKVRDEKVNNPRIFKFTYDTTVDDDKEIIADKCLMDYRDIENIDVVCSNIKKKEKESRYLIDFTYNNYKKNGRILCDDQNIFTTNANKLYITMKERNNDIEEVKSITVCYCDDDNVLKDKKVVYNYETTVADVLGQVEPKSYLVSEKMLIYMGKFLSHEQLLIDVVVDECNKFYCRRQVVRFYDICKKQIFYESLSSNDKYNLIDPNSKDAFVTNDDGNFVIEFHLDLSQEINGVQIFSAEECFPKSFDIKVKDEIVKSVKNANELNGKNKNMIITFDEIYTNRVCFIQTGPNWDKGTNILHIKRIELLSANKESTKGIFETVIGSNKDPHKCGVTILTNDTNVCTHPLNNSWYQIELRTKTSINGFILKRFNHSKLKSYKVICTDDSRKPQSSWTTLININESSPNENLVNQYYKFPRPSPPTKFVRLVSTGRDWNGDLGLKFVDFRLIRIDNSID